MYNYVHMQTITATEARKKLPDLIKKTYFESESFLITKGGVPMAEVRKPKKSEKERKYTLKEREKAINELAGMWKNRWKGKTTEEVVEIIRKKAWRSHASRH